VLLSNQRFGVASNPPSIFRAIPAAFFIFSHFFAVGPAAILFLSKQKSPPLLCIHRRDQSEISFYFSAGFFVIFVFILGVGLEMSNLKMKENNVARKKPGFFFLF
jgi:hypothetical protein